jgi:hypothetical protein
MPPIIPPLAGRFLHQVNVALKAYLAVAGPSAKPEPCSTKAKTLSIVGAIEPTKEYARRTGRPRRREGVRTITIDHALIEVLGKVHKHLRLVAGIPDGLSQLRRFDCRTCGGLPWQGRSRPAANAKLPLG